MTEELALESLVPAADCGWQEHIFQEHRRAELHRLEEGWPGCGCAVCQKLYQRIDLFKYGRRVQRQGGTISISEDQAKRAKDRDYWTKNDSVFVHYGKGYAVDKKGHTYCTGPVDDPQPSPDAVSTAPVQRVVAPGAVTRPEPIDSSPDYLSQREIRELAGAGMSTRTIQEELAKQGVKISYRTIARRLQRGRVVA